MNNPMQAAIRKRRTAGYSVEGDHEDMTHRSQHTQDQDNDSHIHDMISKMDPDQLEKLKAAIASKEGSGTDHGKGTNSPDSGDADKNAEQVAKGGASQEEQNKIQSAAEEENRNTALSAEDDADHDLDSDSTITPEKSDQIALSMLDSRDKHGMAPSKPRNLGERMRGALAAKLKGKGKL